MSEHTQTASQMYLAFVYDAPPEEGEGFSLVYLKEGESGRSGPLDFLLQDNEILIHLNGDPVGSIKVGFNGVTQLPMLHVRIGLDLDELRIWAIKEYAKQQGITPYDLVAVPLGWT